MQYATPIKTARMTATRDAVAEGTLELQAANDDVLAVLTLTTTGGSVTGDTWTVAFDSNTAVGTAAAGSGTDITKAQFKNSGGTAVITGLTVGTSGTHIVLDNVNLAEDQSITITSATIQHAT